MRGVLDSEEVIVRNGLKRNVHGAVLDLDFCNSKLTRISRNSEGG